MYTRVTKHNLDRSFDAENGLPARKVSRTLVFKSWNLQAVRIRFKFRLFFFLNFNDSVLLFVNRNAKFD